MADPVHEKINAHIKWLYTEITDCEAKSFATHAKGEAYLQTLRESVAQFERLAGADAPSGFQKQVSSEMRAPSKRET
jgi:hypothetical protein